MKKIILAFAIVATLSGCMTHQVLTEQQRYEISWGAFCAARGYNLDDITYRATNEYLDTWCGSIEEEEAFIAAGVEHF